MFQVNRATRWQAIVAVSITGVTGLSGCGSDGPPEQARTEVPALTGTATYDLTVRPEAVAAKGATGPLRTASNSSGTNQYTLSLTQLTAPYLLRYTGGDRNGEQLFLYTVATQPGVANITPLTTLLVAQLLGQDPAAAYAAFGPSGGVQMSLITDANITAAQEKLTVHLRDVLGVQVQSGTASFITAPFSAVRGDPMLETLMALDARLAADGIDLPALASQVAGLARLCIQEKIQINVIGEAKEFCPATKTATPRVEDSSILDYVFVSSPGDSLTLSVRENSVLSARYVTAAGTTYSCDLEACGVIALSVPASDLTRSITFNNTELSAAGGNAVLSGTLMGPIPGVALPVLPCDHNKFIVILPDRRVAADCVDAADPLSLGGTINDSRGEVPSRAGYTFSNTSESLARPRLQVVTDGNDSLLSVYFSEVDPDTFRPTSRFACERSVCNGVTLGPVTVNTELLGPDLPILIRRITFEDTVLPGLDADGSSTGTSAVLQAAFTTVYFVDPASPPAFPPFTPCAAGSDSVSITVLSGLFNFCAAADRRFSREPTEGGLELSATHDDRTGRRLAVLLQEGNVVEVSFNTGLNQVFRCSGTCAGVTIAPPDALGNMTVTFANTLLHEVQDFPLPGERSVILNGALTTPPLP